MTIPANTQWEQAPYGATPVVVVTGAQGGPYSIVTTFGGATAGDIASGTAESGNPVKIGGRAKASFPAGVADNQRVDSWWGQFGQLMVGLTSAGVQGDAVPQVGCTLSGGGATQALAVAGYLFNGATLDRPRGPVIFKDIPSTAVVAGTGIVVWTPAAGKKFRAMGYALSLSVAGSIILCDNVVATVLHRTPTLLAATPFVAPPMGNGQLSAAANNVLRLDVTAGGNVAGFVFGTEE